MDQACVTHGIHLVVSGTSNRCPLPRKCQCRLETPPLRLPGSIPTRDGLGHESLHSSTTSRYPRHTRPTRLVTAILRPIRPTQPLSGGVPPDVGPRDAPLCILCTPAPILGYKSNSNGVGSRTPTVDGWSHSVPKRLPRRQHAHHRNRSARCCRAGLLEQVWRCRGMQHLPHLQRPQPVLGSGHERNQRNGHANQLPSRLPLLTVQGC